MTELGEWRPPIVETDAVDGDGVDTMWDRIRRHREHLERSGELQVRRHDRVRRELELVVSERLFALARRGAGADVLDRLTAAIEAGTTDPWAAADEIVEAVRSSE